MTASLLGLDWIDVEQDTVWNERLFCASLQGLTDSLQGRPCQPSTCPYNVSVHCTVNELVPLKSIKEQRPLPPLSAPSLLHSFSHSLILGGWRCGDGPTKCVHCVVVGVQQKMLMDDDVQPAQPPSMFVVHIHSSSAREDFNDIFHSFVEEEEAETTTSRCVRTLQGIN